MEVLCGGDYRRKKKKRHFFLSPSSAFVWANHSLTVWQAWIIVEFQDGDLIFWRLQLVLLCFDPAFWCSIDILEGPFTSLTLPDESRP